MRLEALFPNSESHISFKAGQIIFKEGDPGDFMYLLMEGIVEVEVQHKVVGAFAPVEVLGEMAVIDPGPRSATVVAKTNCRLIRVNTGRFLVLVKNKPEFALHIMRTLVERMRWMDSAAGRSLNFEERKEPKQGIPSRVNLTETQPYPPFPKLSAAPPEATESSGERAFELCAVDTDPEE